MAYKCTFYGVRGSLPVPEKQTIKYGGNTTCIVLECGDEIIILDAGSGLRNFSSDFLTIGKTSATFLFSHFHWDHIQGFPFFSPLHMPNYHFTLYGEGKLNQSFADLLKGQVMHPFFPVSLDEFQAKLTINQIKAGKKITLNNNILINTAPMNHPDKCIGYRIEYDQKKFVFCTDTEHYSCFDHNVIKLANDADALIYDSTYTEDEYAGKNGLPHTGWGHSTNIQAALIAKEAGVKHLFLTHHDTSHDDNFLEEMLAESRTIFPNTFLAHEGMELFL